MQLPVVLTNENTLFCQALIMIEKKPSKLDMSFFCALSPLTHSEMSLGYGGGLTPPGAT